MENSYVFGYVWKVELNDFFLLLLFFYKFSYYNVYSVDNLKKTKND